MLEDSPQDSTRQTNARDPRYQFSFSVTQLLCTNIRFQQHYPFCKNRGCLFCAPERDPPFAMRLRKKKQFQHRTHMVSPSSHTQKPLYRGKSTGMMLPCLDVQVLCDKHIHDGRRAGRRTTRRTCSNTEDRSRTPSAKQESRSVHRSGRRQILGKGRDTNVADHFPATISPVVVVTVLY